jgi:hypothetical protein
MSKYYEIFIRFDIMLAKNNNILFNQFEIDDILNKITSNKLDQKNCYDFFIKYDFLIRDDNKYYYTLDKIKPYKPYKNYLKIISTASEDIVKELDFSSLII